MYTVLDAISAIHFDMNEIGNAETVTTMTAPYYSTYYSLTHMLFEINLSNLLTLSVGQCVFFLFNFPLFNLVPLIP